jgi:periplasmic protein TonB
MMRRRRGPARTIAFTLVAVLHLALAVLALHGSERGPPTPPELLTVATLLPRAPIPVVAPAPSAPAIAPPAPPTPPRLEMPVLPPIIQTPISAPAHTLAPPAPPRAVEASPPPTAAAPPPEAATSLGSSDRMPLALADNPPPAYPELARRKGFEGTVVLRVSVSETGEAMAVALASSSGHDLLDARAIETVRRWRFQPARSGGRTVPGLVLVPITFVLHV